MPNRSVRHPTSRVYRHTVKRQLEASLTLPHIQKHGFTPPRDGYFLRLPRECAVVLAREIQAVAQVVLAVLHHTIGYPGAGCAALMSHRQAGHGFTEAVPQGSLLRRMAAAHGGQIP